MKNLLKLALGLTVASTVLSTGAYAAGAINNLITVNGQNPTDEGLVFETSRTITGTSAGISDIMGVVKVGPGATVIVNADAAGNTDGSAVKLAAATTLNILGQFTLSSSCTANSAGAGFMNVDSAATVNEVAGIDAVMQAYVGYTNYAGPTKQVWNTASPANLQTILEGTAAAQLGSSTAYSSYLGCPTYALPIQVVPTVVSAAMSTTALYPFPVQFDTSSGTGLLGTTEQVLVFSGINTNYITTAAITCSKGGLPVPAEFAAGSLPQGVISTSVPLIINGNNKIAKSILITSGTPQNPYIYLLAGTLDIEADMTSAGILPNIASTTAATFAGLTSGSVKIGDTSSATVDWSTVQGNLIVPITISTLGKLIL